MTTISPMRNREQGRARHRSRGEPIDRAVEHERRNHAARRQAGDEVVVFQWPWERRTLSRSPRRQRPWVLSHVGRSPGLIDEDGAFGIEIELAFEPGFGPLQDVGAVLLRGGGPVLRVWRGE